MHKTIVFVRNFPLACTVMLGEDPGGVNNHTREAKSDVLDTHTHMHAHTYTCMHARTHAHTRTHTHTHVGHFTNTALVKEQ